MPEFDDFITQALETAKTEAAKLDHEALSLSFAVLLVTVRMDSPRTFFLYMDMLQQALNEAKADENATA